MLFAIGTRATANDQATYPTAEGTSPKKRTFPMADEDAAGTCRSRVGNAGTAGSVPAHTLQAVAANAPIDSANGFTTTW